MQLDSVPEPIPDRTGLVLQDRYKIVRKLGEGGMGEVYEAEHLLIGKRVAIKCLHPQFARDPRALERFKREARTASMAGNEHIVDVNDLGVLPDGCPYMVMEFLAGRELAELIEDEGPFSVGRLVRIVEQVCEALSVVHAQGIVHRDLKPQNILIVKRKGNRDFVKILDFGVSKVREGTDSIHSSLTRTGALIGTPHYMAPEQSKGSKNTDHRADIYALGVIMYLGLIGKVPFDGETLPDLIMNIMTEEAVPPSHIRSDLPTEFSEIVMRAFAKNPDDRFATAAELAEALAPFRDIDYIPTVSDFGRADTDPPVRAIVPRTSERPGPMPGARIQTISHVRPTPSRTPIPALGDSAKAFVAGFLLLGSIAGGLMYWRASTDGNASESEQALIMQPGAPAEIKSPEPPPPQDRVAMPSEKVRIQISASPSDARIYINGDWFPNPLDTERPRSPDPVTIEVKKEGYQSMRQAALFDNDLELKVDLKPIAKTHVRPKPTPNIPNVAESSTRTPQIRQTESRERKVRKSF
ncbi:MAG: serine/threonine protein kinase [Myxococcales bacterium]|nr:MAG: serine/threonine protein kinase [Myxococcales bacterium]